MKRISNLILSFVIILTQMIMFPVSMISVCAATTSDEILAQMDYVYAALAKKQNMNDYENWCGKYVADQLEVLGLLGTDECRGAGNVWYGQMSAIGTTSTGYRVSPFDGKNCINDIVSTYGNAYNIVVGFSKGAGSDGATYGHVLFIHAIIDGTVYWTESWQGSSGYVTCPIGKPVIRSVSDFYYVYRNYTFDGAVVLTKGDPSESNIWITNASYPTGNRPLGKNFGVYGIITSNYPLSRVWGGVYNADGTPTVQWRGEYPDTTSFNLYTNFDPYIIFDDLPEGNFIYKIEAVDSKGFSKVLVESTFSVGNTAPSSITISGESYPTGNRPLGKNFGVYGVISSTHILTRVWGGVYNADGSPTPQYLDKAPNATSYNLYTYFDPYIIFDDLPEGNFIYKIEATDSKGYSKVLVESSFSVGDSTPSSITISDERYPAKEHALGKNQGVYGIITSAQPLVRVWGGVYYTDGTPTTQYRDKKVNSKSVNLYETFDPEIIFNDLPIGDYLYKFDATDSKGYSKEVICYNFSVVDTLGSDITISGEKYPTGNLKLGGNFGIYGKITSTYPLARVWGGVYNWDGSPTQQFRDEAPNWASFDIYEKFDPYIIFNDLPEGDFIYKIEATDSKGYSKVLIESAFTVGNGTPSGISISGEKYPSGTHPLGKNLGLYGVITSTFPLTRVWGGVYNAADGTPTTQYCDQAADATSFDLSIHFDPFIIFDDLPEGDYIYKIEATDQKEYSKVLIESAFSVVKPSQIFNDVYEKGIDVSEYQDTIDWNTVAESGIQFAIIRAATTNFMNAEYMEDKFFQSNYENARKAGIKVGIYMYSSANTQEEIEQNISSLLKTLGDKKLDLPVFIDVEQASRQTEIGKEALTDVLLYGCTLIQNAGYQAGVYANQGWYANYIDADALRNNNVTVWLAAWPYTNSPADPLCYDYSDQCTVWQYSDKGLVAGISGYVDLDFSYHIYESIQKNKTGDVNGDGSVDMKDVTLMRRALAGWDVTINEQYADVNGDGSFDMKDVTILRRYLAGWDVTLA